MLLYLAFITVIFLLIHDSFSFFPSLIHRCICMCLSSSWRGVGYISLLFLEGMDKIKSACLTTVLVADRSMCRRVVD